ncbi:hypothetical protein ACSQ67_020736 [Phaseolus vulgaris]
MFIVTKPYSRVRHRHLRTRIQHNQLPVTNPIAFEVQITLSMSRALSRLQTFIVTKPYSRVRHHHLCTRIQHDRLPVTNPIAFEVQITPRCEEARYEAKEQLKQVITYSTLCLLTNPKAFCLLTNPSALCMHTNPSSLFLHTFIVTKPYSRVRHRHLRTRIQHNQLPMTNPIAFKSSNYASDVKRPDLKVIKCSRVLL